MPWYAAWDPEKAKAKQKSPEGVTFEEARAVFEDANALTITDYESDPNEERFITIGMSAKARVLVVVLHMSGRRDQDHIGAQAESTRAKGIQQSSAR
jgi:uncharacterized protein